MRMAYRSICADISATRLIARGLTVNGGTYPDLNLFMSSMPMILNCRAKIMILFCLIGIMNFQNQVMDFAFFAIAFNIKRMCAIMTKAGIDWLIGRFLELTTAVLDAGNTCLQNIAA